MNVQYRTQQASNTYHHTVFQGVGTLLTPLAASTACQQVQQHRHRPHAKTAATPTHTTLGHIRQDTRHHWWTYSPKWVLDTAVTRLRIGHTRLNAHLHRLTA
ncbi:hypothetical protein E2C01_087029 [Portunus trituberculatus]|uniref:Uncharacterized protein n=1 Tax=Portunus trituberculatus TaxID=210409 RepID=A0A5B7JC89_PORTR|nr:hypothetical protein [Portunus trituberculatus]